MGGRALRAILHLFMLWCFVGMAGQAHASESINLDRLGLPSPGNTFREESRSKDFSFLENLNEKLFIVNGGDPKSQSLIRFKFSNKKIMLVEENSGRLISPGWSVDESIESQNVSVRLYVNGVSIMEESDEFSQIIYMFGDGVGNIIQAILYRNKCNNIENCSVNYRSVINKLYLFNVDDTIKYPRFSVNQDDGISYIRSIIGA